jgi:hypothetical protein
MSALMGDIVTVDPADVLNVSDSRVAAFRR